MIDGFITGFSWLLAQRPEMSALGGEHFLVLYSMIQEMGLALTKHVRTRTIFIKMKTTPCYLVCGYQYFPHEYISSTQTHTVLFPDMLIDSTFQ